MDSVKARGSQAAWPGRSVIGLRLVGSIVWWRCRLGAQALSAAYGVWGWGLLLAAVVATLALGSALVSWQEARQWQHLAAQPKPNRTQQTFVTPDATEGLLAFERVLLPHEDIPQAVGQVLRLAQERGVSIKQAEYRAVPDLQGGFLRYRIELPIQGASEAVYRYLFDALQAHPYLALEAVQFKREGSETKELDAKVRWVLLARLPHKASGPLLSGARP